MSPDAFGYNPDLPDYSYDPAGAKKLLAEAGYPDGVDATLDVEAPFKEMAEAIASMLTQGRHPRQGRGRGGRDACSTKLAAKGEQDGDMLFSSWGNGSLDPADIFVPTLRTGDRGNFAGYSNPEVDKLLDAADTEIDPEARRHVSRGAGDRQRRGAVDLPVAAAGYLWRVERAERLAAERRQPHQPAPGVGSWT